MFYQQTLFRAFLHLDKQECEEMVLDDYIKYTIMLKEYLKILHAPYMKTE